MFVLVNQRLTAGAGFADQRDRSFVFSIRIEAVKHAALHGLFDLLHIDLDVTAAGEADFPGLLVRDAEFKYRRLAALHRAVGRLDHSALDAAARYRALKMALVIDDDNQLADMTSLMLMQLDYNTLFCATFEQGLDIFAKSKIDLIVTDIFMPGMGGIEGIRQLKQGFPDCTILAMSGGWSGMSPADAILAAQKIGADAGLQKPFNAKDLKLALESLER